MQKTINMCIIIISLFFCCSVISLCAEKNSNTDDVLLSTSSDENIGIEILDVKLDNKEINIKEKYPASAILTIKVVNNSMEDIELSNFDIYPYQNKIPTKYFVSTNNDNINGFIGTLKSKESKVIKIGVALYNTNDSIIFEMDNIEDNMDIKIIKEVNIK